MMRFFVLPILACGLAQAADGQRPSGVPKGAVQTGTDSYEHKDDKGRTWYYRRSPFGWIKTGGLTAPDRKKDESAPSPAKRGDSPFGPVSKQPVHAVEIKVREKGDSLEFERVSPFGPVRWTRLKTELNQDEQAAWDRHRAAAGKEQK